MSNTDKIKEILKEEKDIYTCCNMACDDTAYNKIARKIDKYYKKKYSLNI